MDEVVFRRSSHCENGECVEVGWQPAGHAWRKSSRCDSNLCVEVAPGSRRTWVRDSTIPGVALSVANEDWADLISAVRSGELDR